MLAKLKIANKTLHIENNNRELSCDSSLFIFLLGEDIMFKKLMIILMVKFSIFLTEVEAEEAEIKGLSPDSITPLYTDGNGRVMKTTPFYTDGSNGLKKVGTLEPGLVFTPTDVTNHFFVMLVEGIQYYIPKNALISTEEKPTSFEIFSGPKEFTSTIITETDVPIRNNSGNVIGIIEEGNEVTLEAINNGNGVIQMLGHTLYVDLDKFQHSNLVNPKKNISHKEMEYIVHVFSKLYPELTELVKIGSSVEGRAIYALRIGNGETEILMDASMHGREHMTTNVLLEMIDEYIRAYKEGSKIGEFKVNKILDKVSIWFVPMMNPDGVTLVQTSENVTPYTILMNHGSSNFNRWKANIKGTDLNRNFDGGWMSSKTSRYPAYKDYKGKRAFSEPESKALRDFIAKHNFKSYITYHSSGSILYYYHHQKGDQLKRDLSLAKKISKVTGYRIMPPTGDTGSGASADWFIMTYKMPGITMEIAPPIKESFVPIKYWDQIWKRNQVVGLVAAEEARSR